MDRDKDKDKETPWPSIVPSSITPPSTEVSIGRRSTASLPLPGDHAGEPLHRFGVPPPTAEPFPMSHPPSSIASFANPRAISLPPPPAEPEIFTPHTTLHPLLDIPSSASSSASSIPPLAHASSTAVSPPQLSAPTTTSTPHPATGTGTTTLNSPPSSSQPSTTTTIATTPQGLHMTVQTTSTAYILSTFLPGYQRDEITLSTRKRRVLHVVADPFLSSRGTGHFERRISFGYDADMAHIRAEFNGGVLKIVVPRRPTVSAPAGYEGLSGQHGNVWGSYGP